MKHRVSWIIYQFGKRVSKFGEWIIWRHWRQWRQWVAPMAIRWVAPMAITIAIGANGDIHWRQWRSPLTTILAPFKWRHLIHSMAILSSQSPFKVSGSFGDPMAPIDPVAPLTTMDIMAIHVRQWRQWCNGDNGTNGDNGDPLIQWHHWRQWSPMAIAIVANGCRHWHHSPNRHWRQWSIHWRHSILQLAPMAPNDPFTKLQDAFTRSSI